jgi:predicted nucleic acid-binding protein
LSLYLLDADVTIDLLKRIEPTTGFLAALEANGHDLLLTAVTAAEVFAGTEPWARAQTAVALARFRSVDITIAMGRKAGEYQWDFARRGVQLATADMLNAGAAFVLGATLVTRNVRHFPMTDIAVIPPN